MAVAKIAVTNGRSDTAVARFEVLGHGPSGFVFRLSFASGKVFTTGQAGVRLQTGTGDWRLGETLEALMTAQACCLTTCACLHAGMLHTLLYQGLRKEKQDIIGVGRGGSPTHGERC